MGFSVTEYRVHQGVVYFTNIVQFHGTSVNETVVTPKTKVQPSCADVTALTNTQHHYFQIIQIGKLIRKLRM
jgi:hypothetical protein